MNKRLIIILAILSILSGAAVWFFLIRMTVEKAIDLIMQKAGKPAAYRTILEGFAKDNPGYVIEWGKAVRKGDSDFIFNGTIYDSVTGKNK